jgi:tight adherence protein B
VTGLGAAGWAGLAGALLLVPIGRARPPRVVRLVAAHRLAPSRRTRTRRRRELPPALPVAAVLIAAAAAALLLAPTWGVAAAAAGSAAVAGWRRRAERRRRAAARAQLRTAVGALTAELSAGGRPDGALAAAATAGPEYAALFTRASEAAARGDDAATVLDASSATRTLGCAWRLGEQTGAGLAAVLGRVAADLEQREQARRAVGVALAGPQASAAVLAGLPLLGLALGAAMGGDPLHFLLGTGAGSLVGAVGVLLDVGGLVWLQAILRRADPP